MENNSKKTNRGFLFWGKTCEVRSFFWNLMGGRTRFWNGVGICWRRIREGRRGLWITLWGLSTNQNKWQMTNTLVHGTLSRKIAPWHTWQYTGSVRKKAPIPKRQKKSNDLKRELEGQINAAMSLRAEYMRGEGAWGARERDTLRRSLRQSELTPEK